MKFKATFTKRVGRSNKKLQLKFNTYEEYKAKRLQLTDEGWKLVNYTQVCR